MGLADWSHQFEHRSASWRRRRTNLDPTQYSARSRVNRRLRRHLTICNGHIHLSGTSPEIDDDFVQRLMIGYNDTEEEDEDEEEEEEEDDLGEEDETEEMGESPSAGNTEGRREAERSILNVANRLIRENSSNSSTTARRVSGSSDSASESSTTRRHRLRENGAERPMAMRPRSASFASIFGGSATRPSLLSPRNNRLQLVQDSDAARILQRLRSLYALSSSEQ